MADECVYGEIGGLEPRKALSPELSKKVTNHFIYVSKVSKSYGGKLVVNDVTLDLNEGQALCILGESGSGKSTLLKLIAGHIDADSGDIYVNSERIVGPADKLVPGYKHIKLIHQNIKLSQFKTIHDNLKSATYEFKPEYREEKVNELLKLTRLEDKVDAFPLELSGGQQQRIAIGAALANEPDVALLDEPFSHLDVSLKAEIRQDLMDMLTELGMTTIFVSHDANDAFAVADKVIVLRNGVIEQIGTPDEIYRNPANEYVARFFGPVSVFVVNGKKQLVRPEQLSLNTGVTAIGQLIIERCKFYGNHYLIEGTCDNAQGIVSVYSSTSIRIGSKCTLYLPPTQS